MLGSIPAAPPPSKTLSIMVAPMSKSNGRTPTLTDLAEAKRLPADFLRGLGLHDLAAGEVGVPYWGPTGEEIAVKRRTALKAKDGSYWPTGTPLAAYGQWRIADATKAAFLIVVEGESDCWALWLHGLPALGLPGANTAKTLLREHVEAVATVYVHREPDAGGEAFVKGVQARLTALGFRGKAFELRMPAGVKDPADLHAADSDQFKAALESCIRAATPIPLGSRAADDGAAEAARGPTSDAWTAPIPFDAGHDLPAFPTHLLPAVLCEWVEAEAEATQTPPDLAGTLALSVCRRGAGGQGPRRGPRRLGRTAQHLHRRRPGAGRAQEHRPPARARPRGGIRAGRTGTDGAGDRRRRQRTPPVGGPAQAGRDESGQGGRPGGAPAAVP